MPVSIVVGGQFGSEGKGKVAHYFAREKTDVCYVVRCGGSNSGHTVIDKKGQRRIFRHLPTASILSGVNLVICAGSYIDLDILIREIGETGLDKERLLIDKHAVIITEEMKKSEKNGGLIGKIGSTGSGTGAAVSDRINRVCPLLFAKDVPELSPFITDVPKILRDSLDKKERILIEGTQGFGLSPLHSRFYPYTTSRDTTAAGFLSETGLSPLDVDEIILTIRAFPIRVAGNSGPLENEIDWDILTKNGNHHNKIEERTSVSDKIRRVANFDSKIVKKAIQSNNPTTIVLNHLDYVSKNHNKGEAQQVKNFLYEVENSIKKQIDYIGFGADKIKKRKRITELYNDWS